MTTKQTSPWRMVHFFGPDGAGKTTQVERLTAHFESRGVKTKRAWVRSPHTFAFLAMQLLYLVGLRQRLHNPFGREFSRPRIGRHRLVQTLWVLLELVSVMPLVLIEAVIPQLRHRLIFAERYLLDSVVTIGFFIQDEHFIDSWAARFLYRLVPAETLLVFLDADYPSIVKRRGQTVEPEEFIEFQRRLYRILATRTGALVIYTPDHSIAETSALICQALEDGDRSNSQRPWLAGAALGVKTPSGH